MKRLQVETAAELDALLPAILDRAFKGEFRFSNFTSNDGIFVMKLSRGNRVT